MDDPTFLEMYDQHTGNSQVTRMIVDREVWKPSFLARLHADGRRIITIWQTSQYRALSAFSDIGTFIPLSMDSHGPITREVAPARISSLREDRPDGPQPGIP